MVLRISVSIVYIAQCYSLNNESSSDAEQTRSMTFFLTDRFQPKVCFKENSSLHSAQHDLFLVVLHLSFYSYIPVFRFFIIYHYKKRFSSLHIYVHHCTFCASLHVKISPAA